MNGEQIRQRRKALGMSQADLAVAVGMPGCQTYISAVERDQVVPKLATLERFATALGLKFTVSLTAQPDAPDAPPVAQVAGAA